MGLRCIVWNWTNVRFLVEVLILEQGFFVLDVKIFKYRTLLFKI